MQTTSSKIWTRISVSIQYEDNYEIQSIFYSVQHDEVLTKLASLHLAQDCKYVFTEILC